MLVPELSGLWQKACQRLNQSIGSESFERFFEGARLVSVADHSAVISLPSDFQQWWVESNYLDLLREVFAGEVPGAVRRITLTVAERPAGEAAGADETRNPRAPQAAPLPDPVADAAASPKAPDAVYQKRAGEAGLKPEYTFGSFVVGPNNRFAHAAAISVGRAPASNYNPLFLHGGVGLGKTHLMQAIGHKLLRSRRRVRVAYLTSEQFTNEFIDAIQRNGTSAFRERYRRAEVLLVDDVQFFAGKERSQEEFFHTFNALLDGQRQVVLTSDRPASSIKNLEPRLVSRFEWGLTVELQAPDEETRVAILRKKAEQWNVRLGDDIIQFLAANIRNNIRRLEGGLTRLATFASLSGERLDLPLCERLLADFLHEENRGRTTIDVIQRKVAEHFDIRLADMTSKRRPAHIALPRQIAMFLARQLTGASLADIGEAFGGRDHGTVIHACRRIEALAEADSSTRLAVARLTDDLRRG
jgi:chromosomal replication initiator protein